MKTRYYIDGNKPESMANIVRRRGNTWEKWYHKIGWVEHVEASGIMVGLGDWVWYDEITEEKAMSLILVRSAIKK